MNFKIALASLLSLFSFTSVYASKSDIGLTCDKEIMGVNRYIEVGNTVSYTLEYLEQNKYRCSEFQGKLREIVSCSYQMNRDYEILLTIEDGSVTEIETRLLGVECN
jgi:hypothetical protein